MKELDAPTADYLRFLDANFAKLTAKHRLRIVVVWVDGDQKRLSKWGEENKIKKLPLSIISSQDKTLGQWNLNLNLAHNAVLLNRKKAIASYGELRAPMPATLVEKLKAFDK